MRSILTGLILALSPFSASAQTRIVGQITDSEGKSIEYVSVGMPFYFGKSLYRRSVLHHTAFKKLGVPFHIGFQIYGRVVSQ